MLCRRSLIAASIALPFAAQAQGSFRSFLAEVSREAWAAGVPSRISASAFLGLMPDPEVIERDQTQPEFTLTWAQYRARVLPPFRIANGRQAFLDNTSLLHNISLNYGVDPGVILAIWGIESNYGANKGKFQLIRSLATLAYQGRRGGYFKSELINALKILNTSFNIQKNNVTDQLLLTQSMNSMLIVMLLLLISLGLLNIINSNVRLRGVLKNIEFNLSKRRTDNKPQDD